jgi:DNA-binding transcriptional LysR family regulator
MFIELFSRGGLSLDRLRSFLAFAQAGSIAKAAPDDTTRQSQISRQIGELESFFGTELTVRRGKTLALSEAGRRLAVLIRQQLQDLDDFRIEQSAAKKAFTIGASASVLDWMVVPAMLGIRKALNDATVRLEAMRSRSVVDAVRDGRFDFGVVREDAIPKQARSSMISLLKLSFHLCIPKCLIKRGTPVRDLSKPSVWQTLPFTAGNEGGQMDAAIRDAMSDAGVDFRPVVECYSTLQSRQLIQRGECAGILPSLGVAGLSVKDIHIIEFAPLKNYGRHLVLHWNERQMRRRGVEATAIKQVAKALQVSI